MIKSIFRLILFIPIIFMTVFFGCFSINDETDDRIRFSGNIELKKVEIAFKIPGKIKELNVEEGDFVSASMHISRLDSDQLEKTLSQARTEIDTLRSKRRELEAFIQYQQETMGAQIEQRKAEVRQAQAVLDQLNTGSRKSERESARAVVEAAEAQAERATRDWQRAQRLYKTEEISTAQYENYRAVFDSSMASLTQAKEQFQLVREGPRSEEIRQGEASLDRARAGLRQAEAMQLEINRTRKSIETIGTKIRAAQAQVEVIESQLEDTSAISPIEGVVLEKSVENGEVIGAGTSIVTIGDLSRPWVRGYIEEPDLGRIKLGAPAEVTTDSYPNKIYPGKVTFIASEAEFTPKQIQTRQQRVKLVYRIKVEIDNPNQELKLNMPVDVKIPLGSEINQTETAG
jgi:HlyD family secretion protein